ncbi:MAG TPA: XdhC/CoxI family protein, partial [Thermoplasmata archaeon]|nr:XdhC/CoxI family protein [Thermoplasmata archaeon]
LIVRPDGSSVGTVGGAALEERVKALAEEAMRSRASDLHHFDLKSWVEGGLPSLCGGSVDVAIEYVAARPNLLLWGGGHVSAALARLLPTLEYDYSVADDRPDWVGEERFPEAERREVVAPSRLFEIFPAGSFTHLYVLGYDAAKDTEVLDQALRSFPNQIGLIASQAKRAHIFAELRRRGSGSAQVERIQAPVGLPIGAEAPEEIAVSIVAEIVRSMHVPRTAKSPEGSPTESSEHADARSP